MKNKRLLGWVATVILGTSVLCPLAHADVYLGKGARNKMPTIKSADDAISSIPGLSKIPKSFIVGDGFRFKLSGQELRIDHMGLNSKATVQKRVCMLGFSFASPVAFFGSRIDVPVFYSDNIKPSRWSANTPGDYIVRFSKDADVKQPTVGLAFSARF